MILGARAHGPTQVSGLDAMGFLRLWGDATKTKGLSNLFKQDPTARAAIRAIQANICAVPLVVYDGPDPKTRKPAEGLAARELQRLVSNPNPWTASRDWKRLTVHGLVLDGETNMVLRGAAFGPLSSAERQPVMFTMHQRKDLTTRKHGRGFGFDWLLNGKPLPFEALIQAKDPDPDDPVRGLPTTGTLAQTGQIGWYARTYLNSYFANGADPGGYLKAPVSLGNKQKKLLLDGWAARHGGAGKTNKTAVLDAGLTYEVPTQKHVDMELRWVMDWTRLTILSVLGVPESEIALPSEQTYSNGLSANAGFWFQTLVPIMKELEEAWNDPRVGLGRRYGGLWLAFDTSVVKEVLKRVQDKVDALVKLVTSSVPVNDAMAYLNMEIPDVEGGDVPMIQVSMAPLSVQQDPKTHEKPVPAATSSTAPKRDDPTAEDLRMDGSAARGFDRSNRSRNLARIYRMRRTYERQAGRITTTWMRDVRRLVLDSLDELEGRADGQPLDELLELENEFVASMGDLYERAADSAADTLAVELNTTLKVWNDQHPTVRAFIERKTSQVRNVTDTLREELEATIREGVSSNETVAQLKRRVKDSMNVATKRAETIARTEAGDAVNGGRYVAMELEGVKSQEWSTFQDEATRESHSNLDGEVVPIGQRFSNGLLYPMEVGAPAAEVINCRCVALAVGGI